MGAETCAVVTIKNRAGAAYRSRKNELLFFLLLYAAPAPVV